MEMEPKQQLTLDERMVLQESLMRRALYLIERLERSVDICVNYSRVQALAAGYVEQAKAEYARLDQDWKALVEERKADNDDSGGISSG